jgi:hypothetical protein
MNDKRYTIVHPLLAVELSRYVDGVLYLQLQTAFILKNSSENNKLLKEQEAKFRELEEQQRETVAKLTQDIQAKNEVINNLSHKVESTTATIQQYAADIERHKHIKEESERNRSIIKDITQQNATLKTQLSRNKDQSSPVSITVDTAILVWEAEEKKVKEETVNNQKQGKRETDIFYKDLKEKCEVEKVEEGKRYELVDQEDIRKHEQIIQEEQKRHEEELKRHEQSVQEELKRRAKVKEDEKKTHDTRIETIRNKYIKLYQEGVKQIDNKIRKANAAIDLKRKVIEEMKNNAIKELEATRAEKRQRTNETDNNMDQVN